MSVAVYNANIEIHFSVSVGKCFTWLVYYGICFPLMSKSSTGHRCRLTPADESSTLGTAVQIEETGQASPDNWPIISAENISLDDITRPQPWSCLQGCGRKVRNLDFLHRKMQLNDSLRQNFKVETEDL